MGWRIRILLVALTAVLVGLLFWSAASLLTPDLEAQAFVLLGVISANLFIGLFALFKVGGRGG